MFRVLIVLALLVVPVHAAPRLKDRKPALDPEAARIAALKAKYDRIRRSGNEVEQARLMLQELEVRHLVEWLDRLEKRPDTHNAEAMKRDLQERIRQHPTTQDLYDIAMYDRKKAAGKK